MRTSPPIHAAARAVLAFLAAAAAAAGCGPGAPAPAPLPPGAAFELDGLVLTEAEIDETAGLWGRLDPAASLPHLRQLALTNTLFPLCGARLADPAARAEAQAAAQAARADIEAAGADRRAVDVEQQLAARAHLLHAILNQAGPIHALRERLAHVRRVDGVHLCLFGPVGGFAHYICEQTELRGKFVLIFRQA